MGRKCFVWVVAVADVSLNYETHNYNVEDNLTLSLRCEMGKWFRHRKTVRRVGIQDLEL